MALYQQKRAVGIFTNWTEVKQALHDLKQAGFPPNRVSVIAKTLESKQPIRGARTRNGSNHAGEGAATGALTGGVVGGVTGLLVGIGALAIPLIGPIMLAGALTTALATTLAGGAIGVVAGGILGLLIGLGIPEERAKMYRDRVLRGDYLVMVEGTDEDIRLANTILRQRGIQEWSIYNAPDLDSADTDLPVTSAEYSHSPR
ncbi:MAG: DUF1269 domain-containing protein [Coleofasciculus sp. Co-bin14]|nr:DUF1269 domain-containing protein [Coleofasciculus sp. Co-bin14]